MNEKLSLLFAFGAMLCWGFGDFILQRTVKKIGDIETIAIVGIVGGIGMFPFVVNDLHLIFSSVRNFLLLSASSIIVTLLSVILLESFKRGKLSVVEIIVSMELPLTILLGVLFLKDILSIPQLIFVGMLFVGVILSSVDFAKIKKDHFFEKGALLAAISALMSVSFNFVTAMSSQEITPLLAVWVPWVVSAFFACIYIAKKGRSKSFIKDMWKFRNLVLIAGIIDTLAWIFFALAVSGKELSIITAITESYVGLAVFLGLKLNREKMTKLQYVGAISALAASFIVALIS